jgi:hypothetical protein
MLWGTGLMVIGYPITLPLLAGIAMLTWGILFFIFKKRGRQAAKIVLVVIVTAFLSLAFLFGDPNAVKKF